MSNDTAPVTYDQLTELALRAAAQASPETLRTFALDSIAALASEQALGGYELVGPFTGTSYVRDVDITSGAADILDATLAQIATATPSSIENCISAVEASSDVEGAMDPALLDLLKALDAWAKYSASGNAAVIAELAMTLVDRTDFWICDGTEPEEYGSDNMFADPRMESEATRILDQLA